MQNSRHMQEKKKGEKGTKMYQSVKKYLLLRRSWLFNS